jgi:hypothetical protein
MEVLQCAWYLMASSARMASSCATNILAKSSEAVEESGVLLRSKNALKECQIILSEAKRAHGIPSSCLKYHEECSRILMEYNSLIHL